MLPMPPGKSARLASFVRLPVGEHQHGQRKLRLAEFQALVLPVVGECFVEPLEQRAGPLGISARRVVTHDVMRRDVNTEAGRQLGQ